MNNKKQENLEAAMTAAFYRFEEVMGKSHWSMKGRRQRRLWIAVALSMLVVLALAWYLFRLLAGA